MPSLLIALGFLAILTVTGILLIRRSRKARGGRSLGANLQLALLLGFGVVLDPPQKHVIEATEAEAEDENAAGDPPS